MLMQVIGYTRSPDFALIHANIEPVIMGNFAQNPHRTLSQACHFESFFLTRLIVQRNMAVRADEQMPRIIGVQVEQSESVLSTINNERFFIAARRSRAEWAGFLSMVLLPTAHISGTMRCPEPLERIGHAGQLEIIGDVRVLGILVFAHTPIKPYI